MGLIARLLRRGRAAGPPPPFFSAADLPEGALACAEACGLVAAGDVAGARRRLGDRAGIAGSDGALAATLLAALDEAAGDERSAQRRFAALPPTEAEALALHFINRGRALLNANRHGPAERCLQLSMRLAPGAHLPAEMLGMAGYLSGDAGAARLWYDQAMERVGDEERGALAINRLINTLPQVAADVREFAAARAWFDAELARLATSPPRLDDPLAQINRTVFHLSYQGEDDRTLLERLAALFLAAAPSLGQDRVRPGRPPRAAGERLRVGVLSLYLGRHSVGAWYRELVRLMIEGGRHEVILITAGDGVDARLEEAARSHGAHVELAFDLESARERVAALDLDLLVYTDVQMHPFPYFLAFARLAPVQALLVGHPSTSGIPALDWFVGNAFQDVPDAQAQYSERHARLPIIPVYVEPAVPPAPPATRAALGLPEDRRLYVCPAMLQKMHPDFDRAMAGILDADPHGEIVLFADRDRPAWQTRLETRFEETLGVHAARVRFRPFAPGEVFLSILLAADCVLDPYHFSGGVTTYIVLAMGAPLVTLPGRSFRSRMSAGILEQAGMTDGIAASHEDYVRRAVGFAADPVARADWRARVDAAHARIFRTAGAVGALEDWIESVARGPALARDLQTTSER